MAAFALCLRSRLRTRGRALLGLVVLVGLAGGLSLGALGVARRTDRAFDRMVERTTAPDLMVNPDQEPYTDERYQQIKALPGVEQAGVAVSAAIVPWGSTGLRDMSTYPGALASVDGFGYDVARPVVDVGRMPDPTNPDEIYVDRSSADRLEVEVGDVLDVGVLDGGIFQEPLTLETLDTQPQWERIGGIADGSTGSEARLTIVGIGVAPDSLVLDEGLAPPGILVTPAFWMAHDQPTFGWWGTVVRLSPGTDEAAFKAEVESLFAETGGVVFQTMDGNRAKVQRAVRPQVVALEVFAALMTAVGVLLIAQAMARRLQLDAVDNPTLDALGGTRVDRFLVNVAIVGAVALAGAVVSVVVAVALSPVGPVGVARSADPHAGILVDGALLALGASVLVLLVVLVCLYPAWRHASARDTGRPAHRSGIGAGLLGSGLPVSAITGIRFAIEPGRGRTAVPVRSTLLGAVTAVAVVAGVLTFSGSLNHLLDTPRLYGSDWDAVVTGDTSAADDSGAALLEPTSAALAASSQVEGYAAAGSGAVTLSGTEVPAVGFAQGDRPVRLTLVEGRAPATSDEVVLGSATMRDLGLTVGDSVVADGIPLEGGETGPPSTLAVVGRAVLPGIAQYSGSDKLSFGRGAIFTADGLQAHSPVSNTVGFVVKLAPDASPSSLEDEPRELCRHPRRRRVVSDGDADESAIGHREPRSPPCDPGRPVGRARGAGRGDGGQRAAGGDTPPPTRPRGPRGVRGHPAPGDGHGGVAGLHDRGRGHRGRPPCGRRRRPVDLERPRLLDGHHRPAGRSHARARRHGRRGAGAHQPGQRRSWSARRRHAPRPRVEIGVGRVHGDRTE